MENAEFQLTCINMLLIPFEVAGKRAQHKESCDFVYFRCVPNPRSPPLLINYIICLFSTSYACSDRHGGELGYQLILLWRTISSISSTGDSPDVTYVLILFHNAGD